MEVIDFVDDEIYALMKKVQKKFNLSWEKARDEVNLALRKIMLSYPEKWLKRKNGDKKH